MEIVTLTFEGVILKSFSQAILVLVPKPDREGKFRGITLLEVVYKLLSSIINCRLSAAISLDDGLHGFWKGRGTGTAIMEAKILSQL